MTNDSLLASIFKPPGPREQVDVDELMIPIKNGVLGAVLSP